MIRSIAAFGLALTILGTGYLIQAQETTQTTSIPLEQLRSDYLFQLEKYREAEQQYSRDRAEFYKLQTLASREKAVDSMRPYLEARARVMFTYMVAMENLLKQAQGIDVTARNQTINKIIETKNYLQSYIAEIPTFTDRETINAASARFESEGAALFFEAQYRSLTLLAIGRVQRAYDQLELATSDFEEDFFASITDEVVKAQVARGLRDVEFQNQRAETALQQAIASYPAFLSVSELEASRQKAPNYQQTYSNTVRTLQTSFSAMKQSIEFLQELEQQI